VEGPAELRRKQYSCEDTVRQVVSGHQQVYSWSGLSGGRPVLAGNRRSPCPLNSTAVPLDEQLMEGMKKPAMAALDLVSNRHRH
jgi:hypothetical protein